MKKIIVAVITILVIGSNSLVFADRITELKDESNKLIQIRQDYTQKIQQIEVRLIEIQGILKEKDKETKEVKSVKTKE